MPVEPLSTAQMPLTHCAPAVHGSKLMSLHTPPTNSRLDGHVHVPVVGCHTSCVPALSDGQVHAVLPTLEMALAGQAKHGGAPVVLE